MNLKYLAPVAALALLTGCSAAASTATVAPAASPSTQSPAPAPSATVMDATLGCVVEPDPAVNQEFYPEVLMATAQFIPATEIDVTVISFGPDRQQLGTQVIDLTGPFAAGQALHSGQIPDEGDITSCEIASVASDVPFEFKNDSPVSGS